MIEMIERMFGDTLWIWTAIAGSLIGAAFLAYFKDTRAGIWAYAQLDKFLDSLVEKYGWTWLEQPTGLKIDSRPSQNKLYTLFFVRV